MSDTKNSTTHWDKEWLRTAPPTGTTSDTELQQQGAAIFSKTSYGHTKKGLYTHTFCTLKLSFFLQDTEGREEQHHPLGQWVTLRTAPPTGTMSDTELQRQGAAILQKIHTVTPRDNLYTRTFCTPKLSILPTRHSCSSFNHTRIWKPLAVVWVWCCWVNWLGRLLLSCDE